MAKEVAFSNGIYNDIHKLIDAIKNNVEGVKRKSSRNITEKKYKKVTKKKKKIRVIGRKKIKKPFARKYQVKKREISDIFS